MTRATWAALFVTMFAGCESTPAKRENVEQRPPAAAPPAPSPAEPACPAIAALSDELFGAQRATPGTAFDRVGFDQPLASLPDRFASWRGLTFEQLAMDPAPPLALAGAQATLVSRGRPPQLFAVELRFGGTGLGPLLAARWGAPQRSSTRGDIWLPQDDNARRRVRLVETGCTTTVAFEPFMTVDELVALNLEANLGKPGHAVMTKLQSWTRGYCMLADGCTGELILPALPFHGGPLCVTLGRGRERGPRGVHRVDGQAMGPKQLWAAWVIDLFIDTCEEPDEGTAPHGTKWDVPASDLAGIEHALAQRFGEAKPCDGDVVFAKDKVRVRLGARGIEMYTLAEAQLSSDPYQGLQVVRRCTAP